MYCRYCYRQIEDDPERCPNCGRYLKEIRIGFDGANLDPSIMGDVIQEQEIVPSAPSQRINAEYIYCSKCGERLSASSAFCNRCGTPTASKDVASKAPVKQNRTFPRTACPRCHGHNIQYDTVAESKPVGCFTTILYLLLALTVLGLFIVIPLMLREKTKTVTYAVCQDCGKRWRTY